MTLGSLYITLLRLIHIFSAVTWIGGAIFMASVIVPTVQAAGPEGGRFMMRMASFGRLSRVLNVSAILTTLAGLLLYYPTAGQFNSQWLRSAHGITLTLGAITGIVTFLHGFLVTGRASTRMTVVANEIFAKQGPPAPEQLKEAQMLGAKLASGAMLTAAMGSIALLLMAAAQTI